MGVGVRGKAQRCNREIGSERAKERGGERERDGAERELECGSQLKSHEN